MSVRFRRKVTLRVIPNRIDWFLGGLIFALLILGLIMVANASAVEAYRDFGDKLYYLKLQAQWTGIGFLGFLITLNLPYKRWRVLALPLLLFVIVCLVLVLLPHLGIKVLGAKRWLGVGNIRFQPSELAKFSFVLWAAAFLANKKKTLTFLGVLVVLVGLIMLQPDLGTSVVLALSGLIIYFVSGASIWEFFLVVLLGLMGGVGLIFSFTYRKERFLTFLYSKRDPFGASYHLRQILIALGSGGLTGLGLGQSRQKYEYLPAVTTDSVFAVIAEETGFIGSLVVVLAFLLLIWRGIKIAKQAPDDFAQLLALGITSWIGLQAMVNLSAMTNLVPLTGIPLPFFSYGGSYLVINLLGIGILLNISKYRIEKK